MGSFGWQPLFSPLNTPFLPLNRNGVAGGFSSPSFPLLIILTGTSARIICEQAGTEKHKSIFKFLRSFPACPTPYGGARVSISVTNRRLPRLYEFLFLYYHLCLNSPLLMIFNLYFYGKVRCGKVWSGMVLN